MAGQAPGPPTVQSMTGPVAHCGQGGDRAPPGWLRVSITSLSSQTPAHWAPSHRPNTGKEAAWVTGERSGLGEEPGPPASLGCSAQGRKLTSLQCPHRVPSPSDPPALLHGAAGTQLLPMRPELPGVPSAAQNLLSVLSFPRMPWDRGQADGPSMTPLPTSVAGATLP